MPDDLARSPEEFFTGHPFGLAVFQRVHGMLSDVGPIAVRVTKSQIAFRRKRGFAYLWLPAQYLMPSDVDVVLSIALGHHDPSPPVQAGGTSRTAALDAPPRDPQAR